MLNIGFKRVSNFPNHNIQDIFVFRKDTVVIYKRILKKNYFLPCSIIVVEFGPAEPPIPKLAFFQVRQKEPRNKFM